MTESSKTLGLRYWQEATDTHKADASYYDCVTRALDHHVLPLISPTHHVLDFGCGDGEYSRLFARRGARVQAIDVAAPLIRQAERTCPPDLVDRIDFRLGHVPPHATSFDLVSCMGVLVCILEDDAFAETLATLATAVVPGGHLVLRETFAWNNPSVVSLDGYVAHYRTPFAYLEILVANGLELLHDEHLATWSETEQRSNHLWILRRH